MTVANFGKILPLLSIGNKAKTYFMRWGLRYRGWVRGMGAGAGDLPVSTEKVIAFCRELLGSKTPAWQRLQAVQAIEA